MWLNPLCDQKIIGEGVAREKWWLAGMEFHNKKTTSPCFVSLRLAARLCFFRPPLFFQSRLSFFVLWLRVYKHILWALLRSSTPRHIDPYTLSHCKGCSRTRKGSRAITTKAISRSWKRIWREARRKQISQLHAIGHIWGQSFVHRSLRQPQRAHSIFLPSTSANLQVSTQVYAN